MGLFNDGPDHTTGISGWNRYSSFAYNKDYPQTILFDAPVEIPSLWIAVGMEAKWAALPLVRDIAHYLTDAHVREQDGGLLGRGPESDAAREK